MPESHYRMHCRGVMIDCKRKSFFLIQMRFARLKRIFFFRIYFVSDDFALMINILKLSQQKL